MSIIESNRIQQVAETIRTQIPSGVLMSLGARRLRGVVHEGNPGLAFDARILPFTKAGDRGAAARTMHIYVTLTAADLYDVVVWYPRRGDRFGTEGRAIHYSTTAVDTFTLPRLLYALDYDGVTPLNPRSW